MLFKTALLASTLALLSNAQSSVSNDPPTPSGSVKQHVIQVGDVSGALKFYPETVRASVGDMVQFQFYPQNHSLAQSSFDKPCEPLAQANGSTPFWSGFMPVSASSTRMPVFSIVVRDDRPMWFYCATGKHCQGGMAGVINPPASGDRTIAAYKSAASSVALTGVPTGAAGSGGSNSSTGTGTGSGSGSGSVPTTTPAPGAASELRVWKGWAVAVCGIVGLLVV
ncbi:unnamed protein product [Tuber melanosporum]|jgi:plastocyanin|uniref:(Perigord truffle) hypothetical protein n=1 Tax=Tuber melanosporum (strain Mel28) TaxID=656061 RepID=D5GIH8_TUBMM|nr:uncharacterized protein GSTUM_00008506001 [Tuber melanosporum]CAZ84321.1 unnamed protein product [Tuber melanosporum]